MVCLNRSTLKYLFFHDLFIFPFLYNLPVYESGISCFSEFSVVPDYSTNKIFDRVNHLKFNYLRRGRDHVQINCFLCDLYSHSNLLTAKNKDPSTIMWMIFKYYHGQQEVDLMDVNLLSLHVNQNPIKRKRQW